MLARNVNDRLHEKMGNLTLICPRKLLIISNIAEKNDMQVVQKCKAGSTIRQNNANGDATMLM